MKPQVGSKVEVHFTGTVVSNVNVTDKTGALITYSHMDRDGFFGVQDESQTIHLVWASGCEDDDDVFTVTGTADPVGWPVEVGDIWEVDGEEYFVHEMSNSLYVEPFADYEVLPVYGEYSSDIEDLKSLNPVLIRRR